MTREQDDDPEKRNLLMEQKEDNKRRQYSSSRSKIDRVRSCESSSSEQRKRGTPYKISSTEQRSDFAQSRTRSLVSLYPKRTYQSEKKESWWFWNKNPGEKKSSRKATSKDDTCSCVSCALRKVVSSEYICIVCLLTLFTVSVIIACAVVFKSGSVSDDKTYNWNVKETTTTITTTKYNSVDSERLKRKIESLNDNRLKNDYAGLNDFGKDMKSYDDPVMIPHRGAAGIDFGPSFRELNSLDESESKMLSDVDWTHVLDSDKNNELQSSDKLREFYKKLVQTDAKIKSLKRINQVEMHYLDDDLSKSPDRSKRSLKLYHYPKKLHFIRHRRSLLNKNNESPYMKRRAMNKTRLKRFSNESEEPTGFVIEKKKLLVQYKPAGRTKLPVKKCSHAPKDLHIHEHQLKHPFYKNTQRLDELLDRFLNKNLPEIMSDPFGLDMLFKHNPNKPCKHPKPHQNVNIISKEPRIDQIPKPKLKMKIFKEEKMDSPTDFLKMLRPESTTTYEKDFYHHEAQMIGNEKQKIVTSSPNDFEVLLSVSTIMNPELKKTRAPVSARVDKSPMLDRTLSLRHLQQFDEEEEDNLGYEDFKEVLRDDMENHDEMDKTIDRMKRMEDASPLPLPKEKFAKYNPPGVHNPNWKGPMPLYPDELSSMVKHGPANATQELKLPYPSRLSFLARRERDITDVEYVEDYLKNKYDKLVEMAQAYSDYGVLDGKKDARNEKNSENTATDRRIKISSEDNLYGSNLLDRLGSGRLPETMSGGRGIRRQRDIPTDTPNSFEQTDMAANSMFFTSFSPYTEGFRIQLKPYNKSKDDSGLFNYFSRHLQFKSRTKPHAGGSQTTPVFNPAEELLYKPKSTKSGTHNITTEASTTSSVLSETDSDGGLIFALTKNKRTLLSTDFQESKRAPDAQTATEEDNIDKFVQELNMQSNTVSDKKELAHYIENVMQKNIKIFSTAHPDLEQFRSSNAHISGMANQATTKGTTGPDKLMTDPLLTINQSGFRIDEYNGNNYLGKIMLTVEHPDFGIEHINLMFDVPLVINFNEEPMMLNEEYTFPTTDNQFDAFPEAVKVNESEIAVVGSEFESKLNERTLVKRSKTFDNLTATWTDFNFTEITETTTPMTANSNSENEVKLSSSHHSMNNRSYDSDNMTLSDFLEMVSDWFKALEGLKVDKPRQSVVDITGVSNPENVTNERNITTESAYPLYDDDNIENIGHLGNIGNLDNFGNIGNLNNFGNFSNIDNIGNLDNIDNIGILPANISNSGYKSRVLLSLDENEKPLNVTEMNSFATSNVTVADFNPSGSNVTNSTSPTTPVLAVKINENASKKKANTKTKAPDKDKKKNLKTKAIFKRNAEDSNLIFWNDIYDDEYGVLADKLDNSVRDKHSVKENDFIQRSGRWVHEKIKKFAENLKINPHSYTAPIDHAGDTENKERVARSIKNNEMTSYPKYVYDKVYKNRVERGNTETKDEDDLDADQKSIFLALTANMKDVCRKAAKAVQQTRNIDAPGDHGRANNAVKSDSREGSMASALMQQLVRLLTDLVDYQVQQKTCSKLPLDLQNFLEWLTYPKDEAPEDPQPENLAFKPPYQDEDLLEQMQEVEPDNSDDMFASVSNKKFEDDEHGVLDKPLDRQPTVDIRSHYLDCLRALQDLMDQYDDMSDEDKTKMMGVKDYLDSQVKYLNKQMAGYDLYSLLEKQKLMRRKRDTHDKKPQKTSRLRRKLHKFIKNFGKKHTRTTASFYDGVQITDMKRVTVKENEIVPPTVDTNKLAKRNLKDVYYKAVADAKKYETVNNVYSEVTHSSTVTIHP